MSNSDLQAKNSSQRQSAKNSLNSYLKWIDPIVCHVEKSYVTAELP